MRQDLAILPRLVCSSDPAASASQVPWLQCNVTPSGHYALIFPLLLFSKFNVLISHVLGLTRFPPRSFSLTMINPLIYFVCVCVGEHKPWHACGSQRTDCRSHISLQLVGSRDLIWVTGLSGQCLSHWASSLTLTSCWQHDALQIKSSWPPWVYYLYLQPLNLQSPPALHWLVLMASWGFVPLLRHCKVNGFHAYGANLSPVGNGKHGINSLLFREPHTGLLCSPVRISLLYTYAVSHATSGGIKAKTLLF